MRAKIRKSDDSLMIRLPKSLKHKLWLAEGMAVDITVSNDQLVISRPGGAIPTLDELVASITDENRHGEWDTGHPVGREVW